ncbi:hypothetical protein BN2476_630151 [Paraburkholderia piptadeniae]|uniref:IstB-like ATP-binding domain-containing protein n=1 Tax=Paraburkholderia piptadeniae TaxID=1701573 RepID=A0A1N7SM19_9BURK|nr:hypothetical protein BN2476_630151 [Paraburkholderia piptadeniae]
MTNRTEQLHERAHALRMYGLLAHWSEIADASWVERLLQWEEQERARRSLERRIRDARLGNFKPLADCDWAWPKRIDRGALEELMALEFVREKSNVVLIGLNGVDKSTLALPRVPVAHPRLHGALYHGWPDARRAGRARQLLGAAPAPASLRFARSAPD